MTGYGSFRAQADGREITAEVKTVNHRYLDVSLRLPRALSFAEDAVRKALSGALRRGHAEVSVQYVNTREDARSVQLDVPLLKAYARAMASIAEHTGAGAQATVADYAALPDVLLVKQGDDDQAAVLSLLEEALQGALRQVCVMRQREGEALGTDLATHLDRLDALRARIEGFAPRVPVLYKERLESRIAELGAVADAQRLAQEVLLMSDRCAIDEELARLSSHIAQMRQMLSAQGEVGKKLDFLTQEMNREVNTIGSKAADIDITKCVVDAKSEIEKLREQVQNVE